MRKVYLFCLLFFIFSGMFVFAWEPQDLTKFPPCMDEGDIIINVGVGLNVNNYGHKRSYFPATRLSLDYNLGIGEKNLPFFIGGVVGYWGLGTDYNHLSAGGRFGYHFNWGVERLDTYAVSTAGWIIHFNEGGEALFGVSTGARFFVSKWFGFWAEVGYTSFSIFDIGVAFKF